MLSCHPDPRPLSSSWLVTRPLDLSVVIPAFNERKRLPATLDEIGGWISTSDETVEVIVSDDGSSDGTDRWVLDERTERPWLQLLRSAVNRGKGHAVRTGMQAASGDRVLFCDADGATPFGELARLDAALADGADIAVGSRAEQGVDVERDTKLHRRAMGRIYSRTFTERLAPGVRDTQCGFKLFTAAAAADVAGRLSTDGFGFDVEIFVIAQRLDFSVREVAVSWQDQPDSKVRLIRDSLGMAREVAAVARRARAGHYGP